MKMMKLNKLAAAAVCGIALAPFNVYASADFIPPDILPFIAETTTADTDTDTTSVVTEETVISSEVITTTEIPMTDLIAGTDADDISDIEDGGDEETVEISEDNDDNDTADNADTDFFPSGNGKLIEDVTDDAVDREFITIQSKNGNSFFIVIDRSSKKEGNVYFMNLVDEYDLLAFSEEFPENAPVEVGTDKKADTKSDKTAVTEETDADGDTGDDKSENPESGSNNTMILIICVIALAGGGAFYYFKIYKGKPKQQKAPQLDEDDEDEEETVNEDDSPDEQDGEDEE